MERPQRAIARYSLSNTRVMDPFGGQQNLQQHDHYHYASLVMAYSSGVLWSSECRDHCGGLRKLLQSRSKSDPVRRGLIKFTTGKLDAIVDVLVCI